MGPHTTSEPATVEIAGPELAREKAMASLPGARREPETMAASVSKIWSLVFSTASGAMARPAASLM